MHDTSATRHPIPEPARPVPRERVDEPTDAPADAPASTEVTISYDHPDNEPWINPVTLTRDVPVAHLYRLIDLLDDLHAEAATP
jgi:hypothetical protein